MNVKEWRNQTHAELKQVLKNLLHEQFKLRMRKWNGELTQFHLVKNVRRDIARVLTLLREKQGKD